MMSPDNRLMPLSTGDLDHPLRDLTRPAQPSAATTESAHLRDYLAVVLKRKWLIFGLVVVVTSLVAIQMYRLPSIYEATTTIQIEEKKQNVLQTKDLVITAPSSPTFWNTQIKLLENPQLARQVIMTMGLQNNPAFLAGPSRPDFLSGLRRILSREKTSPAKQEGGVPVISKEAGAENGNLTEDGGSLTQEESARLEPYEDMLRGNLTVEPVEKTDLVEIRFKHTDPEMAMKVADTYAKVFIYNDIQRETAGSQKASESLAKEIADLQMKIQTDENAKINYLKEHGIPLNTGKGVNLPIERVTTYSAQLLAAEDERRKAQAAYEASQRETDPWNIPEVQEDKSVQQLRQKISDLEEQRAALLVQYTPEWPAVKKIDEQIRQIKDDLDKIPPEILNGMKSRYQAALAREQQIQQAYFQERNIAEKQSQDDLALSNLNQQLETNKQFYNTLYQRAKELEITSVDRSNNVSIATPSRLPREPIGPPRGRNILIALLLSLGTGIGLAFLLDYLDDTLKSIEDVDRHLHLPTLALIPAPRSERLLLSRKGATANERSESTALALIEEVRSPIAEAYRHLRTSLLLSSAGQPPKTVLVTSSQPSEGKTTTAVNTAVMLAQTGAEVLILDCDLRRPRIHVHFTLQNARGLTNYLSGEADLGEVIQSYEKIPNLKVITSGPVPPNAAELLGSDEMRKLLHQLSDRFTHIIIDSPPAISFTDASILSTMVDGVMLVVHGGRSSRAVVRRAKQQLLDVGAHIYGIVLNNVKLESHNYYYYSGYYSSYYASDDELTDTDGLAQSPKS